MTLGRTGEWGYPARVKTSNLIVDTGDERYAAVVEKVRALGFRAPSRDAWRKRLGAMAGSPHFDEALRLEAEWRAQENLVSLAAVDVDS
jgi:hypothetical protein